jgi:hypothetical protein
MCILFSNSVYKYKRNIKKKALRGVVIAMLSFSCFVFMRRRRGDKEEWLLTHLFKTWFVCAYSPLQVQVFALGVLGASAFAFGMAM